MRMILALLLAAVVGFVAAYWIFGSKREPVSGLVDGEPSGTSSKGLRFNPAAASREVPTEVRVVTRTLYTTGTNKLGAREVLETLLKLHPNAGEESRNRVFRQI